MSRREATISRILAAAKTEFAAYGYAGARVDRIAGAAACNKQALYAYFGDKEGLWKAVYAAMVVDTIESVPIDAGDLPGYAVRLFDHYRKNPEILRLSFWHSLEQANVNSTPQALDEATKRKVAAIKEAQEAGHITRAVPAELLLSLILRISMAGEHSPEGRPPNVSVQDTCAAIVEAVRRLVRA